MLFFLFSHGQFKKTQNQSGKRHININFLVRLGLGRPRDCPREEPGLVPGTNPLCPRDKPRFSPYLHNGSPELSQGQTQFVPGTILGMKGGREVYVLKVYVFRWLQNKCSQNPGLVNQGSTTPLVPTRLDQPNCKKLQRTNKREAPIRHMRWGCP